MNDALPAALTLTLRSIVWGFSSHTPGPAWRWEQGGAASPALLTAKWVPPAPPLGWIQAALCTLHPGLLRIWLSNSSPVFPGSSFLLLLAALPLNLFLHL